MSVSHPLTLRRLALVSLVTFSVAAFAAEPATPAAKALGPQSPVESYNAPVAQPTPLAGLIDFPRLIAAPGPNDGLVVLPSLERLRLEIVDTSGGDVADGFVIIAGESRTGKTRASLYAALRQKLAAYRHQRLTLGDVRKLQQDVTAVYAELGYPLMSVVVPPQEIADRTLRVQINEFKLAAWKIVYGDGQGGYGADTPHWSRAARLAAILNPLLAEPILQKESLETAVKAINRNPYRQARVVFEPGQDRGDSTATIQIDERRRWGVEAGYNNYATKASGTHRFSLGGNLAVPLSDQQLSWNVTVGTSLRDFQNYSLIYTIPLGARQKLTANANYSDTISSSIPGIDAASKTLQTSLEHDLSLVDGKTFSWSLSTTGLFKRFKRASIFGDVAVGGADFESVQLQLSSPFNWRESTATDQIVLGTVLSFSGVTARNTDADFRTFYNSPDGRATTQQYTLNYARVQQLGPWVKALDGWTAETQISWQFAKRELAGSDAFSIGGPSALRAYPASTVNGDDGAYLIQMVHSKPWSLAGTPLANPFLQQVAITPLAEIGWAHYAKGGSDHVWDGGVLVNLAGSHNFSVSVSVAFAGTAMGEVKRGNARAFVGAHWSY